MNLDDPTSATLAIAAALERAGISAAVYGGMALAAYGEPRETKDADFAVAGVSTQGARDALLAASLDPKLSFERVRFGGNLITRFALLGSGETSGFNVVDLVEPRSARYARGVFDRVLEGPLRDRTVRIVSPEDFVVLKVLSTRDRDLEDAASVVRSVGERLDLGWLTAELEQIALELPDHEVAARARRVLGVSNP